MLERVERMLGREAERDAELLRPPRAPAVSPAALGRYLGRALLAPVVEETGEKHRLVQYRRGDLAQAVQGDVGVGRDEIEVPVDALPGQAFHDGVPFRVAHAAPARDLVQRAAAAAAGAARRIQHADVDAGALQPPFFAASARPARVAGSLPSTPQIHWPMPSSRSRSTPVSMPMPCSM